MNASKRPNASSAYTKDSLTMNISPNCKPRSIMAWDNRTKLDPTNAPERAFHAVEQVIKDLNKRPHPGRRTRERRQVDASTNG